MQTSKKTHYRTHPNPSNPPPLIHARFNVPLQHLGEEHPAAQARDGDVQRQDALIEHADDVVVAAHDAQDDVVLGEVARRAEARGGLHLVQPLGHLGPGDGLDAPLRDAQLVVEKVTHLHHDHHVPHELGLNRGGGGSREY